MELIDTSTGIIPQRRIIPQAAENNPAGNIVKENSSAQSECASRRQQQHGR